jgi:hypothetical protein
MAWGARRRLLSIGSVCVASFALAGTISANAATPATPAPIVGIRGLGFIHGGYWQGSTVDQDFTVNIFHAQGALVSDEVTPDSHFRIAKDTCAGVSTESVLRCTVTIEETVDPSAGSIQLTVNVTSLGGLTASATSKPWGVASLWWSPSPPRPRNIHHGGLAGGQAFQLWSQVRCWPYSNDACFGTPPAIGPVQFATTDGEILGSAVAKVDVNSYHPWYELDLPQGLPAGTYDLVTRLPSLGLDSAPTHLVVN